MESKAHYKKCVEKGLNPNKTIEDAANSDGQPEMTPTDSNLPLGMEDGDIASDDYSEGDDMESSGKHHISIAKFNSFISLTILFYCLITIFIV